MNVVRQATTAGLPRRFWWIWTTTFINKIGGFVIPFMTPFLTANLGHSALFAGACVALFGAGTTIAPVVSGRLADRIGRRKVLLLAHFGTAAAVLGLAAATTPVQIAVAVTLIGLAHASVRPAAAAMMVDLVDPKDRVRAFSLDYWANNLGLAIAAVAAGALLQFGYTTLFVLDAATTLACAVVAFLKLPETQTRPAERVRHARTPMSKRFWLFLAAMCVSSTILLQYTVSLPLAMSAEGLDAGDYGVVLAVNGVLVVLLQLPVTHLIRENDPAAMLALSAVLMGAGFGLTAIAGSTTAFALTVAVWTVGEIIQSPTGARFTSDLAPPEEHGRYQGAFAATFGVAKLAAPLIGGAVYTNGWGSGLWAGCAVAGLLCAVVFRKLNRQKESSMSITSVNTYVLDPDVTDPVVLDGRTVSTSDVRAIAEQGARCEIDEHAMRQVARTRESFEELAAQNIPIYGVTTGYGEMVYMLVENDKEQELQTNLVRSHCAGVGPVFSETEARAMLAARVNALSRGYSAVRPELIDRMVLYLNENIVPAIPEVGSLGASGDLAPLSHIAATLIGEGYVLVDGKRVPTAEVLRERGIEPLALRFKEGLALINGTSAMTGLGTLVVQQGFDQVRQAEIVTALVLEIMQSSASPFLPEGHELARPHQGQIDCAANMRALTAGSRLMKTHSDLRTEAMDNKAADSDVHQTNVYIQKAYTLRCIPQIVGAIRDVLRHASDKLSVELNSSNDNPLFFEGQEIFHGGNFHGQPVAFALDYVTIGLTQLGVVSERRTNRLLNRHLSNGLPEFLVAGDPGLHSGFAGAQYPATALVAENRTISPASIQSVPSNGDNQDVVSMGLIAGRNARRVLQNNNRILAVEYLCAAQAVDIAGCAELLSPAGRATYDAVRALVPALGDDRYMSDDIEKIADALARGVFLDAVKDVELL